MTPAQIEALARALDSLAISSGNWMDGHLHETDAAAILAALPPDWCGHEAEIARLRHGIQILQDNWPKTVPAPMDAALEGPSDAD